MIEMQTTCRTCGESWTPDHADYVRGDWRVCQRCRDGPGAKVAGAIEADSTPAQGQITSRKCQAERTERHDHVSQAHQH